MFVAMASPALEAAFQKASAEYNDLVNLMLEKKAALRVLREAREHPVCFAFHLFPCGLFNNGVSRWRGRIQASAETTTS